MLIPLDVIGFAKIWISGFALSSSVNLLLTEH